MAKPKTATYYRPGWQPVVMTILDQDKAAGTVDLANPEGNLAVGCCPLVDSESEAKAADHSAAVLGGDLPPTADETEAAAQKKQAAAKRKQAAAAKKAAAPAVKKAAPEPEPEAEPAPASPPDRDPIAEASARAKAAAAAKKKSADKSGD